jgi:hypothetical protein
MTALQIVVLLCALGAAYMAGRYTGELLKTSLHDTFDRFLALITVIVCVALLAVLVSN